MSRTLLGTMALLVVSTLALAQTRDDSLAIRQAALDYIDGWWEGNPDRIARALHPELAKRIVLTDSTGRQLLRDMTASELVFGTGTGGGSRTPRDQRRNEVTILDIFNNAAGAKVNAGGWVDYMHLAKWNGRWLIVNVLWERRPAR